MQRNAKKGRHMKRIATTAAALLLMAQAAFANSLPGYKLTLDVQQPSKQWALDTYENNQYRLNVFFDEQGSTWNPTGWEPIFRFGTNYLDSTSMSSVTGTVNTTSTTNGVFQFAAADLGTNGRFFAEILVQSNGLIKTWNQGWLNIKKSPGAGTPAGVTFTETVNWASIGSYIDTTGSGPIRLGTGLSAVTNADGSATLSASSATDTTYTNRNMSLMTNWVAAAVDGALNMGGNIATNYGTPSADDHVIDKGYADGRYLQPAATSALATAASVTAAILTGSNSFVDVSGDTMTGALTMNGGNIVMSGAETVDGRDVSADGTTLDAVAATYVAVAGDTMTGDLTMGANVINLGSTVLSETRVTVGADKLVQYDVSTLNTTATGRAWITPHTATGGTEIVNWPALTGQGYVTTTVTNGLASIAYADAQDTATLLAATNSFVKKNGDTMTGALTMSGANIILNGEWLSGDGGDEGIAVDAAGQVGIGTVSPVKLLHIQSGTAFEGMRLTDSDGSRMIAMALTADNGYGQLTIHTNDATTILLSAEGNSYINGGNVGIGTASPSTPLHILASTPAGFRADTTRGDGWNSFIVDNGVEEFAVMNYYSGGGELPAGKVVTGDGDLAFADFDSLAGYQIGTYSYQAEGFKIVWQFTQPHSGDHDFLICPSIGNVAIGTNAAAGAQLMICQTNTTAALMIADEYNDTTPFIVDASGSVGVKVSSPDADLHVAGTFEVDDLCAELVMVQGVVQTVSGADYEGITNWAQNVSDSGYTTSATGGTITVSSAGRYRISIDCSFETDGTGAAEVSGHIYTNGAAIGAGDSTFAGFDRSISAQAAQGSAAGSRTVTLPASCIVDFRVDTAASEDLLFNHATFRVERR